VVLRVVADGEIGSRDLNEEGFLAVEDVELGSGVVDLELRMLFRRASRAE